MSRLGGMERFQLYIDLWVECIWNSIWHALSLLGGPWLLLWTIISTTAVIGILRAFRHEQAAADYMKETVAGIVVTLLALFIFFLFNLSVAPVRIIAAREEQHTSKLTEVKRSINFKDKELTFLKEELQDAKMHLRNYDGISKILAMLGDSAITTEQNSLAARAMALSRELFQFIDEVQDRDPTRVPYWNRVPGYEEMSTEDKHDVFTRDTEMLIAHSREMQRLYRDRFFRRVRIIFDEFSGHGLSSENEPFLRRPTNRLVIERIAYELAIMAERHRQSNAP